MAPQKIVVTMGTVCILSVIFLMGSISTVDCVSQMLQLRPTFWQSETNFDVTSSYTLNIRSNIPDTSVIPVSSPSPGRVINDTCISGLWALYYDTNYKSFATLWEMETLYDSQSCQSTFDFDFDSYHSLRFIGPQNTLTKSLHLFSEVDFQGEEIVLDEATPAEYDFAFPIKSWFLGGTAKWRLYESTHFTGPYETASTYPTPIDLSIAYVKNVTTPIGSIYKESA